MTVLIVGDPDDLSSAYVGFRAEERDLAVLQLAEASFGTEWFLSFDDSRPERDHIEIDGTKLGLADVAGAYVRFHHDPGGLLQDEVGPQLIELYAGQRRSAIHAFLERLRAPVVNRPLAGLSNGSKPFQMPLLERYGLEPPAWIASNDVDEIRDFARSYRRGCIVKSCSGIRSEVRELDDEYLERLEAGSSAVIVQERVPGDDVRVHTVGHRSFATVITGAGGVDYRFASSQSEYQAGDVPEAVSAACCRFADEQGLLLAGFDFKVCPDGRWWCLECNPAPTFLPYEMSTGQPIAAAVLDLFGGPPRN